MLSSRACCYFVESILPFTTKNVPCESDCNTNPKHDRFTPGYQKTLCSLLTAFSCCVGIKNWILRELGSCSEEPLAADRWDKVWGVKVFAKLWNLHHLEQWLLKSQSPKTLTNVRDHGQSYERAQISWGAQTLEWCSFASFTLKMYETELPLCWRGCFIFMTSGDQPIF